VPGLDGLGLDGLGGAPMTDDDADLQDEARELLETMRPMLEDIAGEHRCAFCPLSTRALYAVAYNAMLALDMAKAGMGDWDRAWRKVAEMRETVLAIEPLVTEHFRATGEGQVPPP
jgi:hypothetical protein